MLRSVKITPVYTINKPLKSLYVNTLFNHPHEKSNVIYKIDCLSCKKQNIDKIYIGETSQPLKTRIKQPIYTTNRQILTSALVIHAVSEGHQFDFENTSILGIERNTKKRKTKEALHILRNIDRTVNFKTDTELKTLSGHYSYIISTFK